MLPAQPGSRVLVALLLCAANATFCDSMCFLAPTLEGKKAWNHAEYATEPFIPGLLLLLIIQHVRLTWALRPLPLAVIFSIPLLATLANWTNGWHHLYYQSASLDTSRANYLLRIPGPIYWLLHAQFTTALTASLALMLRHLRQAPRRANRESLTLLLAALFLLLLELVYLSPRKVIHLLVMSSLGVFTIAALLCWALIRRRVLDPTLLARGAILENMEDAFLVVDRHECLTDFNLNAGLWLGCSELALGEPIRRVRGLESLTLKETVEPWLLQAGQRHIRFLITPLHKPPRRLAGWLLLGRDDTQHHAASQALKEAYLQCARTLQRTLAQSVRAQEEEQRRIGHDIHDSLCQDLAGLTRSSESLAAAIQAAGQPTQSAQAHALVTESKRILKTARTLAHDLALSDLNFLNFGDSLAAFAEHAEQWLGVQVDVNLDEETNIQEPEVACNLLRIIREAMVNAARHGQARQIWVDVLRQAEQLRVTVSNNGLPIPSVSEIREGLGLRQMHMRARLLGGQLTLRNQPPNGVVLELAIPEALLRLPAEDRIPEVVKPPSPEPAPSHVPAQYI